MCIRDKIKCEQCGTVYEVESKGVVKIINLLSFFMIFYLIYYFLNFMEVDFMIRVGICLLYTSLVQTNWVVDQLKKENPGVEFEVKIIKTKGDLIKDLPLDKIGDKGLFVKEIEKSLLDGEIDMAVHSMKDMPSYLPEGLKFAHSPKREDPRDALIFKEGYKSLDRCV